MSAFKSGDQFDTPGGKVLVPDDLDTRFVGDTVLINHDVTKNFQTEMMFTSPASPDQRGQGIDLLASLIVVMDGPSFLNFATEIVHFLKSLPVPPGVKLPRED